ncbi:hypothetical protein [Paenibacillus polysaccharolyticus]|uniref:hypothetical protein n=1 Tax=Paenibacillus polysaccharolyticus TaxID=582692 RepID=UPI00300AC89D
MKYVDVNLRKEEISRLIQYIETYVIENKIEDIDTKSKNFYRFISKQIVFFKIVLNSYPNTYFVKVIISDFLSLILNDLKLEMRYYYLNQRSIIENYIRLILKDDQYTTNITKQSFIDIREQLGSELSDNEYSKVINEYKIACSFIHGGDYLRGHLVSNFEDALKNETQISERQRTNQIDQFIDMINILNKLFLLKNIDEIDSSFHRSKATLEYLMGKRYIDKFHLLKQYQAEQLY